MVVPVKLLWCCCCWLLLVIATSASDQQKNVVEEGAKTHSGTKVVSSLYTLPDGVKAYINSNRVIRTGLSGAAAGSVQVATLMWLRTVTSYQSSYDVSFVDAVATLYADGGVERFYRGVSFALVQGPLSRFGSIVSNSIAERVLERNKTYILWLNNTLRRGVPEIGGLGDDAMNAEGTAGASVQFLPLEMSVSQAITSAQRQYAALAVATVDGIVALNSAVVRQLSPAAVGSVFSGLWRVLLMPLDTLKTIQQVEGASGYATLLAKLAGGDIGSLYEGTVGTLLAATVGHYPWFYMYNLLDNSLGTYVRGGKSAARLPLFSSIGARWSQYQAEASGTSVPAVAALVTSLLGGLVEDLALAYSMAVEMFCSLPLWENKLVRSAFIGFMASTVSDISSNIFRVLKTIKQTSSVRAAGAGVLQQIRISNVGSAAASASASALSGSSASYVDIVASVVAEDGLWSLFTRGLGSRIVSNGVQSILFTVVWKELMARYAVDAVDDVPDSPTDTYVSTTRNAPAADPVHPDVAAAVSLDEPNVAPSAPV